MEDKTNDFERFTNIAFCQKKFYTKTAWKKAMRCMKVLIDQGYAEAFDYGRGKGKYRATDKGDEYGFNILYKIVEESKLVSFERKNSLNRETFAMTKDTVL